MVKHLQCTSLLFLLTFSIHTAFSQVVSENKPDSGKINLLNEESFTVVVHEDFETGLPSGWTQQYLFSPDGLNVNWETRTGAGPLYPGHSGGRPDSAAVGDKNLVFQFEGQGHRTLLISSPIDLEFIVNPVLNFYHAQRKWDTGQDELKVYYRKGETGNWIQLRHYKFEVPLWTERSISLTDHDSDKFYLGFEGINGHGSGVLIDELTIVETGFIPKELNSFTTEQASYDFIPTGSKNNPILRSRVRVSGNTGNLLLEQYIAHSQNTDDSDIEKVKLYWTLDEDFSSSNLVAVADGFTNGEVNFNFLNYDLPTGYSYLWLTYDIDDDAIHGNYGDAYIPAGGIKVNDGFELTEDQNPPGEREIYETIFYDDFDTDKGWILTGEFERDIPQGLGGSNGRPGASLAYTGEKVLGSDLTGLGDFPGDYEPGLDTAQYVAITPSMDCFYFKDVTLTFHRWLNTEFTDKTNIHISTDGGQSWIEIWQNDNFETASTWSQWSYPLNGANRKGDVKIRFSVGPTDATNNYSGWNIDNLVVTGEFVTHDVGVSAWIGPDEGCGMSDSETVIVDVNNYGAWPVEDPIPMGFSLDGGQTWHMDTLYQEIPVEGTVTHTFTPKADFSVPGRYDDIIVKTFWELDQFEENDTLNYSIFSIPVISPPYTQNFNTSDGLWTGYGQNSSWQWAAMNGDVINHEVPEDKAWGTNPAGAYNSLEASWLESPCFNFSENETPAMEFYLNTHTPEDMDGVGIQYSLDEGETWQDLSAMSDDLAWYWYTEDDDVQMLNTAFGSPKGWHGSMDGWNRVRVVMEPAISQQERVKFRLIFASQDFGEEPHTWEGAGFDRVSFFESPDDVGIAAVVDPVDACELSTTQSITVSVQNFGLNAVKSGTEIPVGVDVNTHEPVYGILALEQDLNPGTTVDYTFDSVFDLSATEVHTITAYTMLAGDNDFYNPGNYNDTLSTTVTVFGYPEFILGDDIYTTVPDTVLLDAGEEFEYYLWQDGSENQTFQVTSPYSAIYTAWVTDYNGCQVSDSLEVITRDLEVYTISQPLSNCELSDNELIEVQLRNAGPDALSAGLQVPVMIFYDEMLYDEGVITLEEDLLPDETAGILFTNTFDFSEIGEYDFRVIHSWVDANPINDTLDFTIINNGLPQPYIGDTIYTTEPHLITLDAGDEFAEYLWQDGSTDQYFTPDNTWSDWYHVTVTDPYGCLGTDSVFVLTYDIEIAEIFEPQEACELTDNEPIGVKLFNHGPETFDAGREFPLVLQFEGEVLSEDILVLDQSWPAGQEVELYFNASINMELPQTYDFVIYQKNRDANTLNDTLDFDITVHGFPDIYLPRYIVTDNPEDVTLEPGYGYDAYLWQDGSTEETFDVQTWGEYGVDVTNEFGCTANAGTFVLPELFDLALDNVIAPDSVCASDDEHHVTVVVKNTGNSQIIPGMELTLSFGYDDSELVEETFIMTQSLLKEDTMHLTFSAPVFPHSPGNIPVVATITFDLDEVEENNAYNGTVYIYELPEPYLGDNIYTTDPQSVVLNPGNDFESYLWQDGSVEPSYHVSALNSEIYSVTVTDGNGCSNTDSLSVITYNLEMDSIIAPASNCTLSAEEPVVVRLFNEGYDDFAAGSVIELGYNLPGQAEVSEEFTLDQPWEKNTYRDFTFNSFADLNQPGIHEFTAFVATPNAVPETDVLIAHVEYAGLPAVELGSDIYTSKPDTVVLDAGPGFFSYYWYDDEHTEQTYQVTEVGWKWVFVTDMYGCIGSDTIYVGLFTHIPGHEAPFTTSVYPNPASDNITLEINSMYLPGIIDVELTDITGNRVHMFRVDSDGMVRKKIDIAHLRPGVYLLYIRQKDYVETHKITIIH